MELGQASGTISKDLETVSEKRRGRPRVFNALPADAVLNRTERGAQNHAYVARALEALGNPIPEQHSWFADRQAILVELGRIHLTRGAPTMLVVADAMSDAWGTLNPTTREVAAWVRRMRLKQQGRLRPASAEALAARLLSVVLEYNGEHPGEVTQSLIGDAISVLMDDCEQGLAV